MAHDETFNEPDVESAFTSDEDFAQLLDDHSHLAPPAEGEILQAQIVSITPQGIIVDFGYKMEGFVPIEQFPDSQFRNPDGSWTLKRNDPLHVVVDRSGPPQEGYILLSYNKAARLRIWDTLEEAMRNNSVVTGRVTERTKGGLMLDIGVPAFMPGSQIDTRPIHDLDQFLGQGIEFAAHGLLDGFELRAHLAHERRRRRAARPFVEVAQLALGVQAGAELAVEGDEAAPLVHAAAEVDQLPQRPGAAAVRRAMAGQE